MALHCQRVIFRSIHAIPVPSWLLDVLNGPANAKTSRRLWAAISVRWFIVSPLINPGFMDQLMRRLSNMILSPAYER